MYANDRRKGRDAWLKLMLMLNIVAWLLLLVAISIVHISQPEMSTGFLRYGGIETRSTWLSFIAWVEPILLSISACSILALGINSKRLKRKNDRLHLSTLVLLVLVLILFWIVWPQI